jgi:hypothetical protein
MYKRKRGINALHLFLFLLNHAKTIKPDYFIYTKITVQQIYGFISIRNV